MARQGTHLYHSFTCQPVCGAARSCLQTGMYATETGVYRNGIGLKPGARTLADHFNAAGYRTGYISIWHLAAHHEGPIPVEEQGGYDYWLASNLRWRAWRL